MLRVFEIIVSVQPSAGDFAPAPVPSTDLPSGRSSITNRLAERPLWPMPEKARMAAVRPAGGEGHDDARRPAVYRVRCASKHAAVRNERGGDRCANFPDFSNRYPEMAHRIGRLTSQSL